LPRLGLLQHGLCRRPFGLRDGGMTLADMDVNGSMVRVTDMGLCN
jgi:hypothetical protein